jgi:hypothetical protein
MRFSSAIRQATVEERPGASAYPAALRRVYHFTREETAAAALGDIPEETGERDGHEDDDAAAESGADASTPSSAPSNWAHSMFGSDAGASSGGGGGGGGGGGCRRASPVETLRRALRGAPEGAVLLSLPIADVEMVLNEVEELRRRVA